MKRMTMWALLLLLTPALMISCGGDKADGAADAVEAAAAEVKEAGHDAADAVSEAVDDASGTAAEMVESTVDEINTMIAEKEGELKAVTDKLAGMSPTDLAGEAGAEMQAKSEALMGELGSLREKLKAAM
jgi:hypothetical protein